MTAIATTRFLYSDYADSQNSTPAVVQNSPSTATGYDKSAVLARDRYTIWKVGTPGTIDFEIDLGTARSIAALAILNVAYTDYGSVAGPSVDLAWSDDGAAWTDLGQQMAAAVWVSQPDKIVKLSSALSHQWWRVRLICAQTFSVGKIMLGKWLDLAVVMAPGSQLVRVQPEVVLEVGGVRAFLRTGTVYRRWSLRFDRILKAFWDNLALLFDDGKPLAYLDHDGKSWHIEIEDGQLSSAFQFVGATTESRIESPTLNLVQLP